MTTATNTRQKVGEHAKAMPEWLTRGDNAPQSWNVTEGQPVRGDAWTNITECEMRVPFGNDEISRLVRAHEMTHAKVSPKVIDSRVATLYGTSMDMAIPAEELRVNMLAQMAGFDMNELRDGSEVQSGEITGKNNDWNGAVKHLLACANTKAGNDFVRGVGKSNNEMMLALREVHKAIKKEWKRLVKQAGGRSPKRAMERIGSTSPRNATVPTIIDSKGRLSDTETEDVQYPQGYGYALEIAKFTQRFLRHEGDAETDADDLPTADEIKGDAKGGDHGSWARPIVKRLPLPRTSDGIIGRKRVASQIGRNPRHLSRLLTDPEKRVFDRKVRGKGGIVLIDQSGSMGLSDSDLWGLLEAAPGAVIIGYSHRPGSTGVPNIWVMAERGKVIDRDALPSGNGGNGVDGPALDFAQKQRKSGEPFIWVCDGIVTDAFDHHKVNLCVEAQRKVFQYGIHTVPTVADAQVALKRAHSGSRLPVQSAPVLTDYAKLGGWRES